MSDKPVFTNEQYVAQLTQLGVWNAPGKPIAFAFLEQRPAYLPFEYSFEPFTAAERTAARKAFGLVAEVANLTFVEVADNGQEPGPSNQRITFRTLSVNEQYSGSAWTYQNEGSNDIFGSDVILNRTGIAQRIADDGFFDWSPYVTLHEILHSIGLSHPGDYNGAGFSYEEDAQFYQDTRQYSIMSYWAAAKTGSDHIIGDTHHVALTPLLYDILALQTLYGANTKTRTGDTVYGFNSNTGNSPFNFAGKTGIILAVWDAGGRDTLDFSGFAGASVINLNAGTFSSGGGLTNNISIAFGAVIENAVGGKGNDALIGNSAANLLDGRGGADKMTGGAGNDVFIVDNVGDVAIETSSQGGTDLVRSRVSFTLGARIEDLTLEGRAAINGTGNSLANRLTGNAADNILDGASGVDVMAGGAGNDHYYVDSRADKVVETSAAHGIDRVYATASHTLVANVENLALLGTSPIGGTGNGLANRITGNSGANILKGGGGADTISGGGGGDSLYGGSGKDVLRGDSGADGFYFDAALSAASNVDSILDFSRADDTIFLDRDVFRGIAADGVLSAAAFRVGTTARDASDRIVYDQPNGAIYYDPDGAGGAAQILFATVTPDRLLTNADFVAFI